MNIWLDTLVKGTESSLVVVLPVLATSVEELLESIPTFEFNSHEGNFIMANNKKIKIVNWIVAESRKP